MSLESSLNHFLGEARGYLSAKSFPEALIECRKAEDSVKTHKITAGDGGKSGVLDGACMVLLAEVFYCEGIAHGGMARRKEALSYLTHAIKAIELNSRSGLNGNKVNLAKPEYFHERGRLHFEELSAGFDTSHFDKAVSDLQKALEGYKAADEDYLAGVPDTCAETNEAAPSGSSKSADLVIINSDKDLEEFGLYAAKDEIVEQTESGGNYEKDLYKIADVKLLLGRTHLAYYDALGKLKDGAGSARKAQDSLSIAKGFFEAAIAIYESLGRKTKDLADRYLFSHNNAGFVNYKLYRLTWEKGLLEQSISHFKSAIDAWKEVDVGRRPVGQNPIIASSFYYRGSAYLLSGRIPPAILDLDHAASLSTGKEKVKAFARLIESRELLARKQRLQARVDYQNALSAVSELPAEERGQYQSLVSKVGGLLQIDKVDNGMNTASDAAPPLYLTESSNGDIIAIPK